MEVASTANPGSAETLLHKNHLQEYAQRSSLPLPVYLTINEGFPHAPRFRSAVLVDGVTFRSSKTFVHRKEAEQEVAKMALEAISKKIMQKGCPLIHVLACYLFFGQPRSLKPAEPWGVVTGK